MVKESAQKLWTGVTYAVAIYTVYNQLKTMNQMKNDLFNELTPEQQQLWIKTFGRPGAQAVPMPVQSVLQTFTPNPSAATPIEQVKAGT